MTTFARKALLLHLESAGIPYTIDGQHITIDVDDLGKIWLCLMKQRAAIADVHAELIEASPVARAMDAIEDASHDFAAAFPPTEALERHYRDAITAVPPFMPTILGDATPKDN